MKHSAYAPVGMSDMLLVNLNIGVRELDSWEAIQK